MLTFFLIITQKFVVILHPDNQINLYNNVNLFEKS